MQMEDKMKIDNKKIEIYKKLILSIPGVSKADYLNTVESSVTTAWGVNWSHDYIARDILQNFRDANQKAIDKINIKVEDDRIIVSAKNSFDIRKLFYVGSNKAGDDSSIGEYGEGFKAACVSMIKLGINDPISISGDNAIVITVGKAVVDGMRPLVYHYFKVNKQEKTIFAVNTYDEKLKQAFKFGMNHFWYEQNQLVGEELHTYNEISVYKATTKKEGYLFYRGIMRSKIPNIPVIINISKKYAAIENKIKADRDRNSFSGKLTQTFFSIFARSGFYWNGMLNNPAIHYILRSSKAIWPKGHQLLSAIGQYSRDLHKDPVIKKLFDKQKYYSESAFSYASGITWNEWYDTKTQGYVLRSDKKNKTEGKIKLPSYFSNFGVPSALNLFVRKRELAEERIKKTKTATLTPKEKKRVNLALECVAKVAPSFSKLYKNIKEEEGIYELTIKACESKDLLGQLKDNRSWNDKTIYLNKNLFKENFGKFFSILTHEMSHVFGRDGQREFSDVLTHLLEAAVSRNAVLAQYSRKWESLR